VEAVTGKLPESEQYDKGKASPPELGEVFHDAWDRFRQAVHVMAKAGPEHRIADAAVKSGPKHKIGKRKAKSNPPTK
jgi:hypothetical protein